MHKFIKIKYKSKITKPIKGLKLVTNFISDEEASNLIDTINKQKWNKTLRRYTQHYGYTYNYTARSITEKDYINKLPKWLDSIINKILEHKYIDEKPDQVIINRYLPGEGIGPHTDSDIFKNKIYSISLGSPCKFEFVNKNDKSDKKTIYLKPKTLLIMKDKARYNYTHSISPNKYDMINGSRRRRLTRYSITFRNVILS